MCVCVCEGGWDGMMRVEGTHIFVSFFSFPFSSLPFFSPLLKCCGGKNLSTVPGELPLSRTKHIKHKTKPGVGVGKLPYVFRLRRCQALYT